MLDLSSRKVYGALKDEIDYIDRKLDDAMVQIWNPGGSYTFENLPAPSADTFRFAYVVTDDFTTTSDFVEGAGIDYPADTTVGVVNRGTDANPVYMYDVSTGAVFVDSEPTQGSTNAVASGGVYDDLQEIRLSVSQLSASKISKNNTPGLVKNDGSIDTEIQLTVEQLSASLLLKADKVSDAVEDNFAMLTDDGDLADSGHSDADYVHKTGDETISGDKTFTGIVESENITEIENAMSSMIKTTQAGNPVVIETEYAQNAKGFELLATATQEGSGIPSPDNVRPIVGFTEKNVERTGKNQLNLNGDYITRAIVPGVYTVQNDSITVVSGSPYSDAFCGFIIPTIIGRSYVISYTSTAYVRTLELDAPITSINTEYGIDILSGTAFTATKPYLLVNFTGSSSGRTYSNVQIELGTEATPYEPYTGTDYTISFGSTVYGVKVTEQGCVVTDASKTYAGDVSEDWTKYSSGSASAFAMYVTLDNFAGPANVTNIIANYLQTISGSETWGNFDSWISSLNGVENKIVTGIKSITTVEDWKTYLESNPLQVKYKLATPIPLPISPVTLALLAGTNVLTTDGDSIKVTYRDGVVATLDDVATKADEAYLAKVESGATASKAYSVNEFMLRSDGFYRVTQPIAQNASITASNTEKTTIGAVLTALLNA